MDFSWERLAPLGTNLETWGIPSGLAKTLSLLYAALLVGSLIRIAAARSMPAEQRRSRLGSLLVWWVLALVVTVSLAVGKMGVAAVFLVFGVLGLREFLALTWEGRHTRAAAPLCYLAVAVQFLLVPFGSGELWRYALPLGLFLLVALRLTLTGVTVGYLHDFATLFWGAMVTGYLLSHALAVTRFPSASGHDWKGWLLYLLILTEGNDIAQALWGRQFGRHRVTPTISPNKTWEGLLFGLFTTVIVAVLLAPWLTTLSVFQAAVAGMLVAASGFFGDINMSAFKRDVGVKDSSRLLPGQGGILDRIDSLSFSAPVFYYYCNWIRVGSG
ncbi:MAG: phosphatidate cytidylyltransferase [Pirellulaceae bacterium]|nr:MAG: phosphatidate cytidylyltransferase [Pirellulaceae bacterium]